MAMTITPQNDTEFETSGRRRKITKFALAGVAVLGVGAALTSAAWSDSVFFATPSSAATFELEGYNPTTLGWEQADTNAPGVAILLPADAIDQVGPNISDSYTVRVRNAGNIPIALATPTSVVTGALFGGTLPAGVGFSAYSEFVGGVLQTPNGVLAPGEEARVDVIVTGNSNWTGSAYQGSTGTVMVQIQGQS